MQKGPWTLKSELQFYPARTLSESERASVASYGVRIPDVNADVIIYSLSRAFGGVLHGFFKVIEEIVGEEQATKIVSELGRRFGANNYGSFLKTRGATAGSPELMCEFQDLAHMLRGPDHASALYGEFDKFQCVVRRTSCIYFDSHFEGTEKYTGIFERGVCVGYQEVDTNLLRVEASCMWGGSPSCEHHFIYREE